MTKLIRKTKNDRSKSKKKKVRNWCSGSETRLPRREATRGYDMFEHDIPATINEYVRCLICNRRLKLRATYCHDGCCEYPTIPKHKTTKEKAHKK